MYLKYKHIPNITCDTLRLKIFQCLSEIEISLGILYFHWLPVAMLTVWQGPQVYAPKPLGWLAPKDQEAKLPLVSLKRRLESLLAPAERASPGSEGRARVGHRACCPETQVLREGNGISPRPSRGGRGNEAPTPRPKECAGEGGGWAPEEGRRTEKGRLFGSLCLHLVALTSCFLGDQRWARRAWPHVQPTPAQRTGWGGGRLLPNPGLSDWLWLNPVSLPNFPLVSSGPRRGQRRTCPPPPASNHLGRISSGQEHAA